MAELDEKYKRYDETFAKRKPQLEAIGFIWDEVLGMFYLPETYSLWWEQVVRPSDEDFDDHLAYIKIVRNSKN